MTLPTGVNETATGLSSVPTVADITRRNGESDISRHKYASARIRRSCRQVRRHPTLRGEGTTACVLSAVPHSRMVSQALTVIADTTVAPRTTTRVFVHTVAATIRPNTYYCVADTRTPTPCLVCHGYWEGTTDRIPILVTNPTGYPYVFRKDVHIARAHPAATLISTVTTPVPESRRGETPSATTTTAVSEAANNSTFRFPKPRNKMTLDGHPYTQDIRLTTRYLRQIEQRFRIEKRHFQETCYNGADIATQKWQGRQRLWINPPWEMADAVVTKLLGEQPREFVLVLPVPTSSEIWLRKLQALDIPAERQWVIPRDPDASLYELWYDERPRGAKPLAWPAWDTMIIHGKRKDFSRIRKPEQLPTLPVVTTTDTPVEWLHGIQIGDLTTERRDQLVTLLSQYPEVLRPGAIGCTTAGQCAIPLKQDVMPIASRPYQYSLKEKEIVEREVQDMLAKGVIEPSSAEWSAPVVLIKKKDGSIRFCVDYRKLNASTLTDNFPLPRLEETLDALSGSTVFSTMDLKSGYWQVPVKESDRDKTSFVTHQGLYRWKRAPFGLKNMPAIFQRLMTQVLAGLTWSQVLVYIDDLIVFGKTWDEHLQRLQTVLDRLKIAGLTVNLSKCSFGMQEVHHLGHVVSNRGIAPDPRKIQAVIGMEPPKTVKQMQQFLGMLNWFRKFVPRFSETAAPLYQLTKKEHTWEWTTACAEAFEELKRALTSAPILLLPDPRQPFVLMTDASDKQIGAVVLQRSPHDHELHPVVYQSRTLDIHQARYATIEKECLALVWAIQENRKYLYGQRFLVSTDHRPLQWLMTKADLTPKLMRWALTLQEYDFQIVYGPGKDNVIADALSRLEIGDPRSVNEYREIDQDAPVMVAKVRQQNHDDGRSYVGRDLLIPAEWWTTAWARSHKLLRKHLRATIVGYDSQQADGKGFRFLLPKGTTSDQEDDEFYYMTLTGVKAYLVPELEPPPRTPEPCVLESGASGLAVNSTQGDIVEEGPVNEVPNIEDLLVNAPQDVDMDELRRLQREDATLLAIIHELQAVTADTRTTNAMEVPTKESPYFLDEAGTLMHMEQFVTTTRRTYRTQFVVPQSLREKVTYLHHASTVGAHLGIARTSVAIRERYYWPQMLFDIRQYVLACHCQGLKRRGQENNFADTALQSSWPNDLVAIDCAGPFPASASGNTYLVIMQDCFTRYVEIAAVPRINAVTIADTIFHQWVQRYGPMLRLLSDNGTEFDNELVVKGLCDLCGIRKIFTTAQHPQSNGMVERLVRTIKQMLVAQMDTLPGSWDERLPLIQFAYNHSLHSATGEVPYYLWYGRPPMAIAALMTMPEDIQASASVKEYRDQLWRRLAAAFELVRTHQQAENEQSAERRAIRVRHDSWEPGDLVWVHHASVSNDFNSRKMYNPWRGPGQVLKVESPTQITVLHPTRRKPRNVITIHPDRIRRYVVPFCHTWQRSDRPFRFPLELLGRRQRHGVKEYRVRWLSVDPTPDSWEAATELPVHLTELYDARWRRTPHHDGEDEEANDDLP